VAGGLAALLALRHDGAAARFTAVVALAVSTLAATQLVVAGQDSFRTTRSAYDILREARAQPGGEALAAPDVPVFQVGMYDQTIPFYLGRTTTLVLFKGELAFGLAAEPARGIDDIDAWVALWQKLDRGFVVLYPHDFDTMTAHRIPLRVLARDTRRVIASRR
jgi:hypothetical protein